MASYVTFWPPDAPRDWNIYLHLSLNYGKLVYKSWTSSPTDHIMGWSVTNLKGFELALAQPEFSPWPNQKTDLTNSS